MKEIINIIFEQYSGYETLDIILEAIAVVFGFLSVWFSKKNKIWVFPTGMVSTLIFVYLLLKWNLLGDMIINAYYFIMSVYGWYIWTRKDNETIVNPISKTTKKEQTISIFLFLGALVFVYIVYTFSDKWTNWTAYVDTFTTGIFFIGMWLMAKRKIENWLFWIVGDIISVPLYAYKGLVLTSIQYFVFTFIAIFGYLAWKKSLHNSQQTL
jgi:nicotinamide mononucleotide transporter